MMNTEMESLIIKNNDEAIEKEKNEKQQHNDEGKNIWAELRVSSKLCVRIKFWRARLPNNHKKYETDRIR